MKTVFVATYLDIGNTCNGRGRPRALAAYTSKDAAVKAIEEDIEQFLRKNPDCRKSESSLWTVENDGEDRGCVWNLSEIEIWEQETSGEE